MSTYIVLGDSPVQPLYNRVKYGLSDVAIIGHAPVNSMQTDTFI